MLSSISAAAGHPASTEVVPRLSLHWRQLRGHLLHRLGRQRRSIYVRSLPALRRSGPQLFAPSIGHHQRRANQRRQLCPHHPLPHPPPQHSSYSRPPPSSNLILSTHP